MQTFSQFLIPTYFTKANESTRKQFRQARFLKKPLLNWFVFFLLLGSQIAQAQGRLAGWNFDNTFAPTAASVVTGITATSVTPGPGISPGNLGSYFIANNFISYAWTSSSTVNANDYIEFTVTPNTNGRFVITSCSFLVANALTFGPRALTLRSNISGYGVDIVTPQVLGFINPANPQFVTLTLLTPIVSSTPVTFRLYGYNSGNNTEVLEILRLDNLQVNGTLLYSTPTSLSGLNATCGAASAAQSFTVGGANLPNNVILSAPTGFELAPNTGNCPTTGYTSTTTVAPASLTGVGQVFCVRRSAGLTPGSSSSGANLTISTGTALSATVALSGSTSAAPSQATITYSSLTTCSGTLSFSACPIGQTAIFSVTGGSGSTAGNVLTLSSAGNYTLSAICIDNASSCSSTASSPVAATLIDSPNSTFSGLASRYCFGVGPVTLTPVTGGGTFSLSGPGNLTNNVYTPPAAAPGGVATITYSVTANGCSASSSQNATTGSQVPPITSLTASGSLGSTNCTVKLTGIATGTAFVFTGPGGYVFSNVYRTYGTYSIFALDVKLPGTYRLTASTDGGCTTAVAEVIVTGTACN